MRGKEIELVGIRIKYFFRNDVDDFRKSFMSEIDGACKLSILYKKIATLSFLKP